MDEAGLRAAACCMLPQRGGPAWACILACWPADAVPAASPCAGATHWGQQSFFLHPTLPAAAGDRVECELALARRKDNQRLLQLRVQYKASCRSRRARRLRPSAPGSCCWDSMQLGCLLARALACDFVASLLRIASIARSGRGWAAAGAGGGQLSCCAQRHGAHQRVPDRVTGGQVRMAFVGARRRAVEQVSSCAVYGGPGGSCNKTVCSTGMVFFLERPLWRALLSMHAVRFGCPLFVDWAKLCTDIARLMSYKYPASRGPFSK